MAAEVDVVEEDDQYTHTLSLLSDTPGQEMLGESVWSSLGGRFSLQDWDTVILVSLFCDLIYLLCYQVKPSRVQVCYENLTTPF